MATLPSDGFSIDLQYRFSRQAGGGRPLSHPLIAMLRAVRDGGSIQAASRSQSVSYRHAWGLLRAAEKELGFQADNCEIHRYLQKLAD